MQTIKCFYINIGVKLNTSAEWILHVTNVLSQAGTLPAAAPCLLLEITGLPPHIRQRLVGRVQAQTGPGPQGGVASGGTSR